eukprot:Stramenopile-MAST_4_protein_4492
MSASSSLGSFWFGAVAVLLVSASLPSVVHPMGLPADDDRGGCMLEPGVQYPSYWNLTALRICPNVTRPEKVCIVGGGSSGVHMGWLLKRRGYENTVLFEARDRLGGFVWTRPGDRPGQGPTTITRELGAAFLSPDYVEVRALLKRYGEEEVPLSVKHMMHFHTLGDGGQDVAEAASAWYNGWVKEYTGTSDPERNGELVGAGLKRYYALHESIFGTYPTRFPPRPRTPGQMQRINGTAVEFLERNNLTLLRPLMYQFFVLQGMGLIDQMSAYYMLKWCSPKSMQLGGFGNDHDFPLAMLKDGYGGIVNRLAKEVDLDVRYGHRVVGVKRGLGAGATLSFGDGQGDEACDVLVLSGPITQFVRGSNDGSTRPILTPPSRVERSVFEGKQAMQFLVSLVEFDRTPAEYEALEFWPEHFRGKGNVIVRRDVGYAETNVSHAVGGIQSFSYYPYPQCNRSVHWDMQQRWAKAHNRTIKQVIGQFYIDTYYYHYSNEDILAGKPWDLENAQMGDGLCNCTMYVGGCASYETARVNGGVQNGNPKWDGKVRFERTWDDQDEDQLGYPDYFKSQTPNYLSVRDQDDDLGGGSFFVEGGVNGGGQNGNPKWDGKIRYERTLDDQDEDQLGYPDYFKSQTPNYLSVRDQDDDLGGKNKISVSGGVSGGGNGRPEWNGRIGFENEWDNDA